LLRKYDFQKKIASENFIRRRLGHVRASSPATLGFLEYNISEVCPRRKRVHNLPCKYDFQKKIASENFIRPTLCAVKKTHSDCFKPSMRGQKNAFGLVSNQAAL
jgi:hypothetical protein